MLSSCVDKLEKRMSRVEERLTTVEEQVATTISFHHIYLYGYLPRCD
jgi:hypothetical protein